MGSSIFEQPKQGNLEKQITYGQHVTKVCVHLFYGKNEDQFGIFWAFLVQFGLQIMHEDGQCKIQICRVFRSKSSNLEGWKAWDTLWSISQKVQMLVKKYIDKICFFACVYEW